MANLKSAGAGKVRVKGKEDNQTKWRFFFRNRAFLIRCYFDSKVNRASHALYEINDRDNTLAHLREAYKCNKSPFVIYEMNEVEDCSVIEMPFLISTSCRDIKQNLKGILKFDSHSMYLYDPIVHFEFKFFLDVCFAFGDITDLSTKAIYYMDRFRLQGGVLRKVLAKVYKDPVTAVFGGSDSTKLMALAALERTSPLNLIRPSTL